MEEKHCRLMHELMNSLTVVLGECELLMLKASAESKDRLEIIRERTTHMAELIRHFDCPAEYEPRNEGFFESLFRASHPHVKQ